MAHALGTAVTEFRKAFKIAGEAGEFDVATAKAVVEVTGGQLKGKKDQLDKLKRVGGGREVVLVVTAKNVSPHALRAIEKAGYKVCRNVDDAARYVLSLR